MRRLHHHGFTVVEVLVVMGIIAILIALLLPAILRVRDASAAIESSNNVRQIIIAVHHFDSDYYKLPKIQSVHGSLYRAILPYLENGNLYNTIINGDPNYSSDHYIKYFVSPSDPTQTQVKNGYCSYAANAQVFTRRRKISNGIRDGLTNTIAFAEHYSFFINNTSFSWYVSAPDATVFPQYTLLVKAANFAENGPNVIPFHSLPALLNDVYPTYDPITKLTRASIPGKTFQVRPTIENADPRIPQTPHNAMIVALMDGSVRRLAGGMSETTFWSAVTPNGGEVLGNDWDE